MRVCQRLDAIYGRSMTHAGDTIPRGGIGQGGCGLQPEHDLFIQLMKLKNTLRHLKGEDLITHLGLEYYD